MPSKSRQLWIKLDESDIKLLTKYAKWNCVSRSTLMRLIILKHLRTDMRKSIFTQK